jgi:hypothetical protein
VRSCCCCCCCCLSFEFCVFWSSLIVHISNFVVLKHNQLAYFDSNFV